MKTKLKQCLILSQYEKNGTGLLPVYEAYYDEYSNICKKLLKNLLAHHEQS